MNIEHLDLLHRFNWSHGVVKIGGQSIGTMSDRKTILLLRTLISVCGKPLGVVFSAPQGVTRKLKETLDGMNDGTISLLEAKERVNFIFREMGRMWVNTKTDMVMSTASPSIQRRIMTEAGMLEQDRRKNVSTLRREAMDSLVAYAGELSATEPNELNQDRLTAKILSMGERLFGSAVMEPITILLSQACDIKCLYVDPKQFLKPRAEEKGFSGVMPDIEKSAVALHEDLSRRQYAGSGQFMVFMPGYYMGSRSGKGVSTMPFNGSDMSAYILAKALNGPTLLDGFERLEAHFASKPVVYLMYVKHVDGTVAETTLKLMAVQRGNDGRELVMGEVLEQLLKDGDSFRIFDPRTMRDFHVSSTIVSIAE